MAMKTVNGVEELRSLIGETVGPSDWREVTQDDVDRFAELSGDDQWIHVDVERAKRELPGGKTIAHGYLTLSLLPRMAPTLMSITGRRRGVNYGSNKVRFISPVPAGSRIRLRQRLVNAEETKDGGVRITSEMTIEVEGGERPAMVAETMGVVYA